MISYLRCHFGTSKVGRGFFLTSLASARRIYRIIIIFALPKKIIMETKKKTKEELIKSLKLALKQKDVTPIFA